MASCSHSDRLVSLLYDGELDFVRRREVAFHIADCPHCTRNRTVLDRIQETVAHTLDQAVARVDMSNFWSGIEQRIDTYAPSLASRWASRLRLWCLQWQSVMSWKWPVLATAALLVVSGVIASQLSSRRDAPLATAGTMPPAVAGHNNQAQIASLSATSTVLVWNEPTSNATVIWVGDTP